MSIFSKKKFLIPAITLLLLTGVVMGVFWPHISSYWRYNAAQDEMQEISEKIESEFPEITDYEAYCVSVAPKNNGWPKVMDALDTLKQIAKEQNVIDDAREAQGTEFLRFEDVIINSYSDPEMAYIADFRHYLSATKPVLELLRLASDFDSIAPLSVMYIDVSLTDAGDIILWPIEIVRILLFCGDYEQAEDVYHLGLRLAHQFSSTTSLVGAMLHIGVKRIAADPIFLGDKESTIQALRAIVGYPSVSSASPRQLFMGELAVNYSEAQLYNKSLPDRIDEGRNTHAWWSGNSAWGGHWCLVAGECTERLVQYRVAYIAMICLKETPTTWDDLPSIVSFLDAVNSKVAAHGGEPYDVLGTQGIATAQVRLRLFDINARLHLLELESGSLGQNRESVEALVESSLQGYIVDWSEPTDIDIDDWWDTETLFIVRPETQIWKRFEDYADPPILVYEPLKTD